MQWREYKFEFAGGGCRLARRLAGFLDPDGERSSPDLLTEVLARFLVSGCTQTPLFGALGAFPVKVVLGISECRSIQVTRLVNL